MSSIAPRQNFHTAIAFMQGLGNLITTATDLSPNSFTAPELAILQTMTRGFEYLSAIVDVWFTDYATAYRDQTIAKINDAFASIIGGASKARAMALLVRCYEIVNSQARAHVDVATAMATVLVDLVISSTSISQNLPAGEYIEILTALWQYVIGIAPSVAAVEEVAATSSKPHKSAHAIKSPHPVSDIDWIPLPAYGIAVALMLKKYYNFDGRFQYQGTFYNVDRVKLATAYESGKKVLTDNARRDGLTSIIYTFKRPDWDAPKNEFDNMMLAVKNTDIITPLDSGTQHVLYLDHARIYNVMPFRQWFDLCNKNGDSVWQFREGDNTTDVSDAIYMIKMSGNPVYPTDTIALGSNDSAKVTNVNGVTLTGIVKDGMPHPDIQFTSQPIY